jgi:hypothetical protein
MESFFRALKETSQLFIGNFSTTAHISMSISNNAFTRKTQAQTRQDNKNDKVRKLYTVMQKTHASY